MLFFMGKRFIRSCEIINMHNGKEAISIRKALNEFDTFIRHSKAVPIIRKVKSKNEKYMSEQVSASKPFGLRTIVKPQKKGDIILVGKMEKDLIIEMK